jgi:predicted transcriptional regulator
MENVMTKTARVLNAFLNGEKLTAKQIAARFGAGNPHRVVHYLREQGYAIYLNHHTDTKGRIKSKYRLGAPSRAIVAAGISALGSEALGPNARKFAVGSA